MRASLTARVVDAHVFALTRLCSALLCVGYLPLSLSLLLLLFLFLFHFLPFRLQRHRFAMLPFCSCYADAVLYYLQRRDKRAAYTRHMHQTRRAYFCIQLTYNNNRTVVYILLSYRIVDQTRQRNWRAVKSNLCSACIIYRAISRSKQPWRGHYHFHHFQGIYADCRRDALLGAIIGVQTIRNCFRLYNSRFALLVIDTLLWKRRRCC